MVCEIASGDIITRLPSYSWCLPLLLFSVFRALANDKSFANIKDVADS
jgi:hypothetical protein